MLDLLIGHFTADITFKSSQEVKHKDLNDVTHLVYYGQVAERLPATFLTLFDDYEGSFIAIGYNTEHLGDRFEFIDPKHEQVIDQIRFTNESENAWEIVPEYIIDIVTNEESIVMVEGNQQGDGKSYPVAVKNNNSYYLSIDNLNGSKKIIIGEVFHKIFKAKHQKKHPAYIRLEDIHPLVDPQNVKEIVEVLKVKNIPFMMAVIPVYTNPETGEQFHFSDSPKLLQVLKDAQKNGGSVVLHGYTHQFRESETGEGFEFWDVENNTPIYAGADDDFTLRTEEEFSDQKEYEAYKRELTQFETNYIEKKLTQGIQELTNYGLYPLAFEAPHYTMSQNGYKVVSEYFSAYVGQIQLSDKNWEIMDSTPYITTPSFLNGLEILPETMGYVIPDNPQAIPEMIARAKEYEVSSDGVLGAFYHPYLGVDQFNVLIEEMEKLPNISWVNLQKMDVSVKADYVDIFTKNDEIIVNVERRKLLRSSIDFPVYHLNRFIEFILWCAVILGGIAVFTFISFTFFLSAKRTKMEG